MLNTSATGKLSSFAGYKARSNHNSSIGRIIGTGIFSTPSSIVSSVGSVGAAMLLWVLGLLLAMAGLCVWLEFACMIPRIGGEKVYLEAAYKRPPLLITTLFAIQAIALGFTGKFHHKSPFSSR